MQRERRAFLRAGLGASLGVAGSALVARAETFSVGVGRRLGGYAATLRAIESCGEWSLLDLAGRTMLIKPNLVVPSSAESGATTDPEVVRAVVDLALAGGASEVLIAEASPQGAHFEECGYGFFDSYDPQGRVSLVDLGDPPLVLAPVPGALAYPAISVPDLILGEDLVFVSVGKMKVHRETYATLSTKNLFGLPAVEGYVSNPPYGRFAMHDRGTTQTIVDLLRLRPVHFAVVDGIWGMEGAGPLMGTPVRTNTVLAGRNPVAVDRVALLAMGLEQWPARHLALAARLGLGPGGLGAVSVAGDTLAPRRFTLAGLAPILEYPRVSPSTIAPRAGQEATALTWYAERCVRLLEVVRLHDDRPDVEAVRALAPLDYRGPGWELTTWDGRDDGGSVAPPGRYAVHVRAFSTRFRLRHVDGVGWVTVIA
jgi:uncharacterized protein (DUF362 family)